MGGYPGAPPADRQAREGLDRLSRDVDRLRDEDIDVSYPQRFFLRTAAGERFKVEVVAGPVFKLVADDGTVTVVGGGVGSGAWGGIAGLLSDQGDLQAALDEKLSYVDGGGPYGWPLGSTRVATPRFILENPDGAMTGVGGDSISGPQFFGAVDAAYTHWWNFAQISGGKFLIDGDLPYKFTVTPFVPNQAYGAGWNGSFEVPTKDAIYDKIESIAAEIVGLLDFKGNQDCSANPNYPAALKGDTYYVSVAGKIGGAAGKSVDIGDVFVAKADNAGGTEAGVGASWFVLEHNLTGALFAANNLSDVASVATARANLGLVIGTDVQGFDADLAAIAALATTSGGRSLLTAPTLSIDASGNLVAAYASAITTPPADGVSFVPQRLLASGGRVLPRFQDESGVFSTMQPHLGRNSVAWMQGTGSSTATISAINMSTAGTATARVTASTNRFTRTRRLAYVSAAGAGSAGGLYSGSLSAYTLGSGTVAGGGGFFAVFRFGCSDAAAVAGAHMFVGFQNTIAAPNAATNPNTFTNCVGVAQLNGGANLNIVYGGSAAQASIDLGANFPAAGTTDLYELILYAPPTSNNTVYYRIERINTGDVATGTLTGAAGTVLPANTTFMGPRLYRSNNATALAVAIDIAGFSVESDFG